tara:strand:+ start:2634 stop:3539 length:906 start_codon:yes stop_codon:yes gene_type:complete
MGKTNEDCKVMGLDCFICDANKRFERDGYFVCNDCRHEELIDWTKQSFIINDPLKKEDILKLTSLDNFKLSIIKKFCYRDIGNFIDIGSSSGKLVFHARKYLHKVSGLEVTDECINFSKNTLGLSIIKDICEHNENIHGGFAFHSLEHFPRKELLDTLSELSSKMIQGGMLVVSVPNADSFQYKIFGKNFSYYDHPNHTHQFSYQSLNQLMTSNRFNQIKLLKSFQYNGFSLTQSLLNLFNEEHNYVYYRLKRKNKNKNLFADFINIVLLPICALIGYTFAIFEGLFPKRQSVLTIIYAKQ